MDDLNWRGSIFWIIKTFPIAKSDTSKLMIWFSSYWLKQNIKKHQRKLNFLSRRGTKKQLAAGAKPPMPCFGLSWSPLVAAMDVVLMCLRSQEDT